MTLHITEFSNVASARNGAGPVQAASGIVASQALTLSAANAASSAMSASTRFVRLHAGEDCLVAIGPAADATSDATVRLSAGQFDYFGVNPGDVIAAVTA